MLIGTLIVKPVQTRDLSRYYEPLVDSCSQVMCGGGYNNSLEYLISWRVVVRGVTTVFGYWSTTKSANDTFKAKKCR